MASWGSFAAAAPALAAKGAELFYRYGVGMGFLGTVRRDGGPRVHPICPILTDDALFALIVPGPKRQDLSRDPRYALHCLTSEPPRQDDAFYLAGTVKEVTDPRAWNRVAEQFLTERGIGSPWPGFEAQTLVEFAIERCLLTLTSPEQGLPSGHTIWHAPASG
jgi:hypothetical protein